MEIKRLRSMVSDIFKTVNDMNPSFINNLFNLRGNALSTPNNLRGPVRYSTAICSISFFLKLALNERSRYKTFFYAIFDFWVNCVQKN